MKRHEDTVILAALTYTQSLIYKKMADGQFHSISSLCKAVGGDGVESEYNAMWFQLSELRKRLSRFGLVIGTLSEGKRLSYRISRKVRQD